MFRSLATRLTAAYVFAAIVLVLIVSSAVTAFALSMFGLSAREASDEVARAFPVDVQLELERSHDLVAAAPQVARHLARPGIRVVLFALNPGRGPRFLAVAPDETGTEPRVVAAPSPDAGELGPRFPNFGIFGPPPDWVQPPAGFRLNQGGPHYLGPPPPPQPRYDRMPRFPFFLDFFLHLEPRTVDYAGVRAVIVPDSGPLVRAMNAFWLGMLPIGIFVVVAAWLLGRYITGQALRPLVETTSSLRAFGAGDFTPRAIQTSDRYEIGELVNAYNAAAAQVAAAFDERRTAELEMRQFVADAGHELRTPLTVIMGFIDVLRRRSSTDPAASRKIYDTMLAESRRMKALIDKLILLARMENPEQREPDRVDFGELAQTVVTALETIAPGAHVGVSIETAAVVLGDEAELHDALANLVENAIKYAPGSPVDIRVYDDGAYVAVAVIDRGPGIPLAEQSQVFARFYRGRDRIETEGFGLGLAIAKRAAERAGGDLTLTSMPGEGCTFTMRVPRAERGERTAVAV
jgi:two-component system, OmpR family, sensor kinase